ncbi:MAG: dnaX [Hyphomicrobiales bacterium]|nr:dnaX [Hyphomicrobiales bacterium]
MDDGRSQDTPPADEQSGFDLGAAAPPAAQAPAVAPAPAGPAGAYRVLARKYRPANFDDLIGQDAMVRTLRNAFELGRIHQAYLLTGVRGVGKTTTARILARAFNYELPAHDGRPAVVSPTIDIVEPGVHCNAIIESRHVDVVEMDAASNTGIDDVREIIESARYKPVMARYKVFIIDEVHMLSKQAFNGLLKTLEEPPEHVKFLFATTEIDKVPVTVRSRCQRFDLRRIESDLMVSHLSSICEREGVKISDKALSLIARAAEGSVRDALSLLDQAIAHGPSGAADAISEEAVRDMLGVADRARIVDLFESVMKGDIASALGQLKEQYDQGADPALVLTDLAQFVHFVTRLKIAPNARVESSATEEETVRGRLFASSLSTVALTRAWQILTKGLQEIKDSPRPLAAADMVLVRIAYASDLPSPEDVLRRLSAAPAEPSPPRASAGGGGGSSSSMQQGGSAARAFAPQGAPQSAPRAFAPPAAAEPRVHIANFEALVKLAQENRDIQMRMALERDVRLVRFEQGSLEFSLVPGASPQLAQNLIRRLQEWTGERWMVAVSTAQGAPTIQETRDARDRERATGVRSDPLVRSVLEQFPGAEIVAVRTMGMDEPPPAGAPSAQGAEPADEIAYVDQIDDDDDL